MAKKASQKSKTKIPRKASQNSRKDDPPIIETPALDPNLVTEATAILQSKFSWARTSNSAILPGTKLWKCPLCLHETVGIIHHDTTHMGQYSPGRSKDPIRLGASAVCIPGNRVCERCESQFQRVPISKLRVHNPITAKHERNWKNWLRGKYCPEAKCKIIVPGGYELGRTSRPPMPIVEE